MGKIELDEKSLKEIYNNNGYFREGYFKIKEKHKSDSKKIILDTQHGDCWFYTKNLFKEVKPNINYALNKTEYFISMAEEIWLNRYDYSRVNYINSQLKVDIICREHGLFKQTPNDHLKGQGCFKCGKKTSIRKRKRTTGGWSLKDWKKLAIKSKNFDSFKVYIIKCYHKKEEFYKIGRTFNTVKGRFSTKKSLPYNFIVLKIFKGTAEEMFELENVLQKTNKENLYVPNRKFRGMYECFSSIENL